MRHIEETLRACGFLAEVKDGVIDLSGESRENLDFLHEAAVRNGLLTPVDETGFRFQAANHSVNQTALFEAMNVWGRGFHEGLYEWRSEDDVVLAILDLNIAGIVRHLNRLGFHTTGSCGGHEEERVRRPAYIMLADDQQVPAVTALLEALSFKVRQPMRQPNKIVFHQPSFESFMDGSLWLSYLTPDNLSHAAAVIRTCRFKRRLRDTLSISGRSGNEDAIRNYVIDALLTITPYVSVDHYGNILAKLDSKGSHHGPTIMVNAHLDSVEDLAEGRTIIEEGSIWTSSEGILGADDRAGVAILLEALRTVKESRHFTGSVKIAFTVEEEIGLVGARQVDPSFLWGVDAAIVVDRRGQTDIVTGTGVRHETRFCHELFGAWVMDIAAKTGLKGWQTTPGGSSDTRIWAEHGIESVNLSAGYQHEHTDRETLDVNAAANTLQLVTALLLERRSLQSVLCQIRNGARQAN
ncbi:peptidase M42 family protein [[Bacillus] selenitireducens MLS10]|uniref:Peptidase M42 family protein n=2 Tax=Salisediminibacterium selenitireducens TaxID=85683 RepID=D6XYB2_BACIE|nr:peptidase M42 family protein [[Bacillus] selenitireducens MLS10]